MKHILLCVALAALLLGCGAESPQSTLDTTQSQPTPAVEPTEPAGTRDLEHTISGQTDGAVLAYAPQIENATALATMGTYTLIFSGESTTTLTCLAGENRYVNASRELNVLLSPDMPSVLVNDKGISYYDGSNLIFLGTNLKEVSHFSLPDTLVGEPAVTDDRSRVYYCTENTLWELTTETGIHRKVKEISQTFASTGKLLLNGTVLECTLESGGQLFLDTQTGLTLWQGEEAVPVTGWADNWFARVDEGLLELCVYEMDGQEQMLMPRDNRSDGWYLPENGYWLTASDLACYDLASGRMISSLTMEAGVLDVAEESQGRIWLLTEEGTVFCWDPAALPSGDDTIYSSPRYTLYATDPQGYETLQALAEELKQRYQVTVLFGLNAIAVQDEDYTLTGEYLVPILQEELEKLEQWLSVFPEGMLKAAVEDTTGGTLYICLVRQIVGTPESGITDTVGATQFWYGDDSYVALAVGQENGRELYHQLYHAMETRMLSKSNACYEWDGLNPKDFAYDYSYVLNQSREDDRWVEENRYFIDRYSMSFPREDRAQIFAYAMVEGNESYFESAAMQKKLLAICKGFREAYDLKKSPETFLWEQYLETSLAYTK